ncbi:MAG TPA: UvrD-helicase domain-containing protein [Gammaproteobacteria bacterium]|nr:UvrD-helicase domain-containing protein [Gammaproteobacteria bacterium]
MTLERLLAEDAAARRAALDVQESCIVRAPAGSGKTELLTQRYLALLATVDEPEEIIAITFTRKAAAEMRARIVSALERAAMPAPEEAHKRATWDLGRRAAARDAERGWRLGQHPARMRIQTIDSLNAELTRQMPLLARFGAQPRVAEEPQTLYEEAARRTLRLLEEGDAGQSQAMAELARHLDGNLPRIHGLITDMLPCRDQWLRHAGASPERAELVAALDREVVAHLTRLREAFPPRYRAELVELAALAAKNLRSQAAASLITACAGLTDLPASEAAALPQWRGLAELLLTKDDKGVWRREVNKNTGFPPEEADAKTRMKELLQRFPEQDGLLGLLHAVRRLPQPEYAEAQWQVLLALLRLLPLAVAQLKLVFAERGEVDFTEVALSALTALGEPEAPTDLALALDYRIRHLLVDEFQDTSVNQFSLLEKLTLGWQAGDGRTLFLVGDPAQSIYRFREAEVGLFLKAWGQGLGGLPLKPLTLHANFRSQAALVDWYNRALPRIFPTQADVDSGAVPYSESAAQRAAAGPAVTVHPLLDGSHGLEAETVCRLITEARQRDPKLRIAVLARAKRHLAESVRLLRRRGLHFQAVEVETLAEQPVVLDLLALTRALNHGADRSAWLAVLRAPWCGLSLESLHALAGPAEALLPERLRAEAVHGDPRLLRSREVLLEAYDARGRGSLRHQVESTWLKLGGPAALPSSEALADAEAYLELLEELDDGGILTSVAQLEQRLQRLFARPDPEADDSLQLMTVHKAKGLEFDVVIVPGLDASTRGRDTELLLWLERPRTSGETDLLLAPLNATGSDKDPVYEWVASLRRQQERLESTRLLYVAVTRARESLHLIGNAHLSRKDGETTLMAPTSASLLALLWPVVEAEFREALERHRTLDASTIAGSAPAKRFTRLVADWQPPVPGPAVMWAASAVLAREEPVPEFEWVGETLRHIGAVVHRLLQQIAAEGAAHWDVARLERTEPHLRQLLAQAGVRQEELEHALSDVLEAARNALADPRGRWLLSDEHQQARGEYALSAMREGRLETGIIDRTFVDKDGVRWVVDYKTSRHSGTDLDAFLERERLRYAPQLERYAFLMRGLGAARVKVALYFPLLQRFLEWEPVDG